MSITIFNLREKDFFAEDINVLNKGDKAEMDQSVNHAIYFLAILLIMILAFALFKPEILHFLLRFSDLWL